MQSLQVKTDELKSNIINKDLKKLKKNKFKLISTNNKIDISDESIKIYNYYIKLTKRLKKYLEDDYEQIVDIRYDKHGKIVWLVAKFNVLNNEIDMPIDIRIMTGEDGDSYMNCSYYNNLNKGILYINRFESKRPNHGYGKLLLENLEYMISNINYKFECINKTSNMNLKDIIMIKGRAIPTKSIISQKNLNELYKKYGFDIDEKNNISKTL